MRRERKKKMRRVKTTRIERITTMKSNYIEGSNYEERMKVVGNVHGQG
jgi:hypothetical protein